MRHPRNSVQESSENNAVALSTSEAYQRMHKRVSVNAAKSSTFLKHRNSGYLSNIRRSVQSINLNEKLLNSN